MVSLHNGKIIRWNNDGYMYVGNNSNQLVKIANATNSVPLTIAQGTYSFSGNGIIATDSHNGYMNISPQTSYNYNNVVMYYEYLSSLYYKYTYNFDNIYDYYYTLYKNNQVLLAISLTAGKPSQTGTEEKTNTYPTPQLINHNLSSKVFGNTDTQLRAECGGNTFPFITSITLTATYQYVCIYIA